MTTGTGGRWSGGKYIQINGAMILGMTRSVEGGSESLLVTLQILNQAEYNASMNALAGQSGVSRSDLGSGAEQLAIEITNSSVTNLTGGKAVINYWIMK
jgi:hypothetical protein